MVAGSVATAVRTVAFYDENAAAYADQWNDRAIMADPRARVMDRVHSPARVLDVGCGTGRDTVLFARAGYAVHGVDLSSGMLDVARASVPASLRSWCWFAQGDMLDLGMFHDDVFDVVWMSASMLHLTAAQAPLALAEAARVIRPGGVLYNTVKAGSGTTVDSKGRFFTFWSADEFRSVVEAAGFAVVEEWPSVTGGVDWLNVIATG